MVAEPMWRVGGVTLIIRLISVPNWTGTGQLELSLAIFILKKWKKLNVGTV